MQQPGMPPFSPPAAGTPVGVGHAATPAAAPSPISSRPPEGQQQVVDELAEGTSGGNRWPRQETLALLKIRSEMDAAFREAALKGPLWDQVSRRLEAMGYKRSAKKCREKFENVDKYYKRTKDGRAGRGDGKTYRFFSELEALHGGASSASSPAPAPSLAPTPVAMAPPAITVQSSMAPAAIMHGEHQPPARVASVVSGSGTMMTPAGDLMMSFSSGSDDDDGEDTTEDTGGKRKRHDGGGGGSSKMMRFLEGLMRQVMERQEEMQQRFMEAMERREQERMIREEAWRRQEVARLAREQDALAQERAMAASRDAAVVSFIQRVTGQAIPMPPASPGISPPPAFMAPPTPVASAAPSSIQPQAPPSQIQMSPKPQQHTMPAKTTAVQPQQHEAPAVEQPHHQSRGQGQDMAAAAGSAAAGHGGAPSPSRWPKAEVHALIQLRTELEARYQDSGPKGPLWEDISAGMRRLGYSRSAKRCKEKWENINKYFKKVKESNKKRPEDSKTCPYYHQLEALYRTKQEHQRPPPPTTVLAAVPLSSQTPPHAANKDCSNGNGCAAGNGGTSGGMTTMQTQASNGGGVAAPSGNGVATTNNKQQEGIATKEEAAPTRPQPVSMNDSYVNDTVDSDSSMDDDDDFDDDDEGSKMQQYEIQFQRQQQGQSRANASGGAGAAGPGPAATTSGSFLTMVHH
ncbi:unnamed protein product [Urochloa decumbens]|uniref:Myb-like domain-containing protein n=1 Tax=Urochloa decumbens TaxID=240449 RepID=A0ABC8X3N9_9POAL